MPDRDRVNAVMTGEVEFCTDDQDPQEVLLLMAKAQVRRLPVSNLERQLVGIVSLGDVATRHPANVDEALSAISEPCQPDGGAQNA